MNCLPCTVTACRGARAKKACIRFCAIILYTLRPRSFPLEHVFYPSWLFFTLRVKWTCSSHLVNLGLLTGGQNPPVKILGELQPPSLPGSYAGAFGRFLLYPVLLWVSKVTSKHFNSKQCDYISDIIDSSRMVIISTKTSICYKKNYLKWKRFRDCMPKYTFFYDIHTFLYDSYISFLF